MHAEPDLATPAELLPILDQLRAREPLLHRPEFPDHAAQLAPGFWEVGASGRLYSRDYVLDMVEQHSAHTEAAGWTSHGHHCTQLGPDTYQLTYTLHQGPRITRRSTIWRLTFQGWQALFHQGTIVQETILAE